MPCRQFSLQDEGTRVGREAGRAISLVLGRGGAKQVTMVAVDEIVAAKQRRASIFCINILKLSEQEKAFFL